MLHYHLISSTPSLLWIPERSSSTFQRYPHVETNYLDLSINGTLFTQKLQAEQTVDKQNKNFKVFQQNEELENNIAKEITTFVRSCQEKSGYFVDHRAQGGRFLPAVSVRSTDEVWSKLEMIPIVAVLAFAAFVVYENRDVVHGVICTRCFWFLVCSGVIFVALSGLFHSIIHRRAWYYFGQTHGFVFVYPSPQRQFVLEGLVNGTWSFWWSLAGMSISDVLPTLRSQLARDDLLRWSLLLVVISYAALNFAFLIKYRWLA
ncbi:unnamed protein product [Peronospora belbahrii]|uniref:Uncharacterized protein n=1 Tax=Peronospora belbahrii TaxID=622444 RepID=A0AAU9LCU4_9STRA|nr:unnamed protein product [Peronospora belbahrii]CAH0518183.1 unnamed protein product [Peronospora belbahrii]